MIIIAVYSSRTDSHNGIDGDAVSIYVFCGSFFVSTAVLSRMNFQKRIDVYSELT